MAVGSLPLEQTIKDGVVLCKLAILRRNNRVNGRHVHFPGFDVIVEMCPTHKHEDGPEIFLSDGLMLLLVLFKAQAFSHQRQCLGMMADGYAHSLLFRASLPVEQLHGKAGNHLMECSWISDAEGIPHSFVVLKTSWNMIREHYDNVSNRRLGQVLRG